MNLNINPNRIIEIREARALSMEEFARLLNVSRQSVSKYEKGIINPSPEIIHLMSSKLNVPLDFFYKDTDIINENQITLFFRSKKAITKKVKNACKYQVKWADDVKRNLEKYVDFPRVDIPLIEEDYNNLTKDDIENLAFKVREEWGLGDSPINDLIGILENQGIIISDFTVNEYCEFKGIDAFSSWRNGTPYILKHSKKTSAVRTRFSLAHELGHLIMHNSLTNEEASNKTINDLADEQADLFASAFLMPIDIFSKDIRSTSLIYLENVKRKWGVSLGAIIYRCEKNYLMSQHQIDYLKRQMSVNRYWKHEPLDDVITIKPQGMLKDTVLMLIEQGILNKAGIQSQSLLPLADYNAICNLPKEFLEGSIERKKPYLRVL